MDARPLPISRRKTLSPDELDRLRRVRARFGDDHDRFSPRELAYLRFLRWAYLQEREVRCTEAWARAELYPIRMSIPADHTSPPADMFSPVASPAEPAGSLPRRIIARIRRIAGRSEQHAPNALFAPSAALGQHVE